MGMKMKVLVFVLLVMLASVTSATIDGKIKRVEWGLSDGSEPIVVKPLILIQNTGDEKARFHVMVAVNGTGKRFSGGCWPTDEIDGGRTALVWPYPLRLADRGDLAYLAVELYSDSCLKSQLLNVMRRTQKK